MKKPIRQLIKKRMSLLKKLSEEATQEEKKGEALDYAIRYNELQLLLNEINK